MRDLHDDRYISAIEQHARDYDVQRRDVGFPVPPPPFRFVMGGFYQKICVDQPIVPSPLSVNLWAWLPMESTKSGTGTLPPVFPPPV